MNGIDVCCDDAGSERTSAIQSRSLPGLLLLDAGLNVVAGSLPDGRNGFGSDLVDLAAARLSPELAKIVPEALAGSLSRSHCILIPPHYLITIRSIDGFAQGPLVVVMIDHVRSRENLATAKRSFALTTRETEILALVLDGASASEVARLLHLAETTVHGYLKRLLGKTSSRNRSAMIAKVLGWRARTGMQKL